MTSENNQRPDFDAELQMIADYVQNYKITSEEAINTAHYCLLDSLGCALLALRDPECIKLLGPTVSGTFIAEGARVPGTNYELDPIQAAFNFGTMIRWLDYNDTWLAAEWGHPSDNFGSILMVADYLTRQRLRVGKPPLTVLDVLHASIKAYEIQGILALENSFNRVGLDHVVLVKVASTAVIADLLGANREQLLNALSLAWVDGQSLRTYRHAPNTGSRKSWAAGDATARAVRLAMMAIRGEMGYPSVLSAKTWGFYDVAFNGEKFKLDKAFGSYVMENILYKIAYPAEFHSQTAVECALQLHPQLIDKMDQVERIELLTQESAVRIINKAGPLHNYADRDHCLQYIVACALLHGELNAESYGDAIANDPRIDGLREKMHVSEEPRFTKDYLDQDKRSIANSIQIFFKDKSSTEKVTVEYPIGHRRRREEGIPELIVKFKNNMSTHFTQSQCDALSDICFDEKRLFALPVSEFVELFI